MREKTSIITAECRDKIENIRKASGHFLASHAYASLYLWRKEMGLSLLLQDDVFSVKCLWKGENAWFFPCGSEEGKRRFISRRLPEPDFKLCYLTEDDGRFLTEFFPDQFFFVRDDTSDEYIYDREGHIALEGGSYANVRTQLHKAEREYNLRTEPLSDENRDDALEVIHDWASNPHPLARGLSDDEVDEEAVRKAAELDITGVVVYVDDVAQAVCAGFPLTEDTFDITVAKCRSNLPGLSYFAKHALFLSLEPRFRYINLEEDLGIPGLRKMKQILAPVRKNEMWEAMLL